MAAAVKELERRRRRFQQREMRTVLSIQSVTLHVCVGSGGGKPGGRSEGAEAEGAAGGGLG